MMRAATLLLLIGLAAAPARADDPPPRAVLRITGEASASVAPDVAVLRVAVLTERPRAAEALTENSRAVAAAIAVAAAAGVPAKDIATLAVDLSPVMEEAKSGPPRIRGFAVRDGIAIRMPLSADVGGVAAALVDKGVNAIDGLSLESSDEAPLRDRLKAEAARDARRQAEIYASALGVRLGRVLDVSPVRADAYPRPTYAAGDMAMRGAAASPPVPIAAGQRDLREQVSVTFAIEP